MDLETLFPFQTLSDADFLNENTNIYVSFSDYQNMYFDPRMAFDRFNEFANIDELSYEINNVECNYYNSSEFHNMLENVCDSNLRIVSLNIRSIPKNLLRLETEYASILHSTDIFCISETYLTAEIESLYEIPSFNKYAMSRKSSKAGGVALYCRSFLESEIVDNLSMVSDCIEMVFVKIFAAGKNYLVGSIYRSPSFPLISFIEEFGFVLQTIATDYKNFHVIIYGDKNINLLREDWNAK